MTWHERVATNTILFRMNILEYEECEYCQQAETDVHALLFCKRSEHFWSDVMYWLHNIGYQNFRLEQKTIILGNIERDSLFNLALMISIKVIYQNRGKRN